MHNRYLEALEKCDEINIISVYYKPICYSVQLWVHLWNFVCLLFYFAQMSLHNNFHDPGQSFLGEKFVWVVVVVFEGKFSVSFGPKPEFRFWIWTWTKLNNCMMLKKMQLMGMRRGKGRGWPGGRTWRGGRQKLMDLKQTFKDCGTSRLGWRYKFKIYKDKVYTDQMMMMTTMMMIIFR